MSVVRARPFAAALAYLLALAGCDAGAQTEAEPIAVQGRRLPLDPDHPKARRAGALEYAGGLMLTAAGVADFGGFSGIDVLPDGRFVSQTDTGELLRGRIVLDGRGRLTGVADASFAKLTDETGAPYAGPKSNADAEDITFLPDGGFAVSFEQKHRVQAYVGGPARPIGVPAEAAGFRSNAGLEALAAWTDAQGRPALIEGAEDGRAWACDMAGRDCRQILTDPPDPDFSLTGLDALPDGRGLVAVYRSFDLIRGMRALVAWIRPDAPPAQRVTVLARLSPPLSIDNMEGIAALPNPDGSIRIYLVSDDNLSSIQRTVLLAFDWRGPRPRR